MNGQVPTFYDGIAIFFMLGNLAMRLEPSYARACRLQKVTLELVSRSEIAARGQPHEDQGAKRRRRALHEHDDHLIADRDQRRRAGENLTGHHAGQLHQTNRSSFRLPSGSSPPAATRVPSAARLRVRRNPARASPRFHPRGPQIALQTVAGECGARHRVAEDHARNRNDVLRFVPGPHLHDDADHVRERRG